MRVCGPRIDVGGAAADSRAAFPLVGEIRSGVEEAGAVANGVHDSSCRSAAHLASFGGSTPGRMQSDPQGFRALQRSPHSSPSRRRSSSGLMVDLANPVWVFNRRLLFCY